MRKARFISLEITHKSPFLCGPSIEESVSSTARASCGFRATLRSDVTSPSHRIGGEERRQAAEVYPSTETQDGLAGNSCTKGQAG
ncbi:hypothetical protein FKM82_000008 [Ascaphus truei]